MHHNTTASTPTTTTTATESKTTTINCATTATTITSGATTTANKPKGIKAKILGIIEINRNTLCPYLLSRGRISNASGPVDGNKFKIVSYVEGYIEKKAEVAYCYQ